MQRKILVTYQNQYNEQKTKTISYANPSATDKNLLDFSRDIFSNLTNNSVIKTQKVDTTDLTSED